MLIPAFICGFVCGFAGFALSTVTVCTVAYKLGKKNKKGE